MNWNWQPASWQQSSWLQTIGNDSLLIYDDTIETGGTQSPDSGKHPGHDNSTPKSRIDATKPVPSTLNSSHSKMGTSRPGRVPWNNVDYLTKNRLKSWYGRMKITKGDEHDMQIWGDIQYKIDKGETNGYVVCKKNELKIHYKICNRLQGWENHYCTVLHIHLSTRHGQKVDWTTVPACYRCYTRNRLSRRRKADAKSKK